MPDRQGADARRDAIPGQIVCLCCPGAGALDRESSACLIALVFEAQAAYLRAGDPDPAVAPFGADTDLGSFLSATSTARGTPALDVELR